MLGKMLIYNLISYNIVCNTNTTTNANEIKARTRVESEKKAGGTVLYFWDRMRVCDVFGRNKMIVFRTPPPG